MKKKILSIILSLSLLLSFVTFNVSASGTDAIATDGVLIDTTEYDNLANLYNQIIASSFNIYSGGFSVDKTGIGGDTNACLAVKGYSTTSTHAQAGYGKQSRFVLATYTPEYDTSGKVIAPSTDTSDRKFHIANQTVPTYWSVDVFDNGAVSTITLQVNSIAMHTAVTKEQLTDNAWNTLAVVYYPNTVDNTKLGYADFYLNGEFIETKDMSSQKVSDNPETRLGFIFEDDIAQNDEARAAYFDNIKVFEMTSFRRPDVTTAVNGTNLTLKDGKITNYVTETRDANYKITSYDATVAAVETLLGGVQVVNANGTPAPDNVNVTAGMKICDSNTIAGVGTFTDSYYLHTVAETYVNAEGLSSWGDGWNRIMGSVNQLSVAGDNGTGVHTMTDGNACAAYKLKGTDLTADTRFNMAECYWKPDGETEPTAVPINISKTPVYVSVDIYDDDTITDIHWETGGGADIGTPVSKDSLNANSWNTFAVVYYPNATDSTKLGYADFYLNKKFVSTTDLSTCNASSYGKEIRLSFKYTAAEKAAYFDNHKFFALTGFDRPDINAGSVTITNGVLTGYGSMTVAELEKVTGSVIKNADGTDAADSARPTTSMKALAVNTVEGVGTFTREFAVGMADRVLLSEDFTDTAEYKNVTADRIGFSHAVEKAGVGGKLNDDGYLKLTVARQDDGSDGTMDSRFAVVSKYVTDNSNGRVSVIHGNPLIYSVDIYPGEGVESLQFDTGAYVWSKNIDADILNRSAWNNITFVFYNTKFSSDVPEEYTWESDMYVNGKLVSRAYSDYPVPDATDNLRFHVISKATNDIFYIDNLKVISTAGFTRPELTSDSIVISETKRDAGTVGGYKGLNVENLKNSVTTSGSDVSVSVYNADGSIAANDAEATVGMYMSAVYSSNFGTYSRIYTLESADFDVYAPEGYANGYVDDKFGKGVYRVENDIVYYASDVQLTATLAQYTDNDELLCKSEETFTITQSRAVGAQINITKTDNTYLKYTLTNKGTGDVLSEKTIYPYDNTRIEKAVKLYQGFTTKAVTFGYDDGVASDSTTVALFNKYGAKATFNLVGKNLERYYGENFAEVVKAQYQGHEIANHTWSHLPSFLMEGTTGSASDGTTLQGVSLADAIADVTTNTKYLKDNLGVQTRGIAWPGGFPSAKRTDYAELEQAVIADGHVYARYIENGEFGLPENWMEWAPTCHHKYLNKYTDEFVSMRNEGDIKLYFVWGHSYEFADAGDDKNNNWTLLENSLKKLSEDNVWFATHGEVYDYVNALEDVEIGDYSIKNNSKQTVFLHVNGENITLQSGKEYKTVPKLYAKADGNGDMTFYSNNVYGTVFAAAYESNGRFVNTQFNKDSASATIPFSKDNVLKGFIFDDINSMSPVCKPLVASKETFSNTRIVCWGDSLTYGQESSDPKTKSYPAVLSNLSGLEVVNMGIGGENAITIAARQGAIDIVLTEDIKIPAEGEVEISFSGPNGGAVAPRNVDLGGWNSCTIAGIEGRLEATVVRGEDNSQIVAYATFTRTNPGTPVKVKAGEKIVPAANFVKGDINIIFTGTNGGWASNRSATAIRNSAEYEAEIEALIKLQTSQAKISSNPDKYIILGLTAGTKEQWSLLTEAMAEAFGEHFIDLRAELSKEEILTSAGITPTSADSSAISNGAVPPSILVEDGTHFNDAGYEAIAKIVYAELISLGYILP